MNPRTTLMTNQELTDLATYRDQCLARGWATGPCDRAAMETAVRRVYSTAGLPEPQMIVWMSSPLGGLFAATTLHNIADQLRDQLTTQLRGQLGGQLGGQLTTQLTTQLWGQLRAQLWAQLGDQLGGQIGGQLWAQLRDQLGGQLTDQLGDQLWAQLRGQLWAQLRDQLRDQLWAQLGGQLGGQLRDQLGDQLRDQLWDQLGGQLRGQLRDQLWAQLASQLRGQLTGQLRDQLRAALWGSQELPWLAFYNYARNLGVVYEHQQNQRLDAILNTTDMGWWWPYQGAVVLTDRPDTINRDSQGRLHHDSGPAVAYADGWTIHAWHGTRVPADLIEGRWNSADILKEPNAEIRRCAIEHMGWDRFVAEAELRQVGDVVPDPGNPGHVLALYDVPEQIYDEPVRVLLCDNATVERDGTRRRFGLTCPADVPDALSAAAWTFGVHPSVYQRLNRAC